MTECTSQEWGDFLIKYKFYHTEGRKEYFSDLCSPLIAKHIFGYDWNRNIIAGDTLAMVRYHDNIHKTYYINKKTTAPTKKQEIIERKRK